MIATINQIIVRKVLLMAIQSEPLHQHTLPSCYIHPTFCSWMLTPVQRHEWSQCLPMSPQITNASHAEYERQTARWMSIQIAHIGNSGTHGMLFLVAARCLGCWTTEITNAVMQMKISVATSSSHHSLPCGNSRGTWTVNRPIHSIANIILANKPMCVYEFRDQVLNGKKERQN